MTNDDDDILMTSETWSDYQALQLIETQLDASLAALSHEQRMRYLKLCRIEPQARHDLAEAIQSFKSTFENSAYHQLVSLIHKRTGHTLDLHHTWLHTRMLEIPARQEAKDPIELLSSLFSSRTKRALADGAAREHIASMTLWQAAKTNFPFHLSGRQQSGQDFQKASVINTSAMGSLSHTINNLDVARFVDIVREFDFASHLKRASALHLATTLNPLISAHRKACFELDLLEAVRSKTLTGQALEDSSRLMQALVEEKTLNWQFFHIQFGVALLTTPETIDLPFCVMDLQNAHGVFSYFPQRPQGALRHHTSTAEAIKSLREQIQADAKVNQIGWLLRSLSLANQSFLLGELRTQAVDESQLNWLAKQLYHAFDDQRPAAERIYVPAVRRQSGPVPHSLLTAMQMRQGQVLSVDLQSIATSTASRDWEQVKKTLLYIGSEILELLTLSAPGGVTGLNRLMMIASLGTLTYNSVSAVEAWARGQSAEFVQALGDIAELIISSRIQTVGARLSANRTRHLIKAIGKPRVVDLPNGEQTLWLSSLSGYTEIDARLPGGLSRNPQGLFEQNGKTYGQIQVDEQLRTAELSYDADLRQYRLKHPDPRQYRPVMHFDQQRGHWLLAPVDISHLTSTELLQTLLRPDMPLLNRQDVQYLQALTQIERTHLEAVWKGEARTPWALEYATRDLQTRRGLDQLRLALETPGQPMPAFADQVLPMLLALQINSTVNIYASDRRTRLVRHTAPHNQQANNAISLDLIQTGPGEYRTFQAPSDAPSTSLLLAALTEHEHQTAETGNAGTTASQSQRLDKWRQQTLDTLKARQSELYAALIDPASTDNEHAATQPLRQRFKHLTQSAARELLRQHPTLKNIPRHAPLEPGQRAAITTAQLQGRLITVFNTLNDPSGLGMSADAEAITCNLLTAQSRWPADLCIQVFQGALNLNGDIVKTRHLLETYGDQSARNAVVLARLNERYAGYDRTNDDMLQPGSGEYPFLSTLLRTLTDAQRDHLKYQLHDGSKLAAAILSQAQLNAASLADLLPTDTTFDLSTDRLAAFQLALDYSASKVDSDGLYASDGKLYVRIEDDFFQVMHDRDASSPGRKVMRIVRPGDPVANDADNLYVSSRVGRSEPITRDAKGMWTGAVTGLRGGGPKTDRLKAMREKTLLERQQYATNELAFQQALSEFDAHFNDPSSNTYFLLAGGDYYQLKNMTHQNLFAQVLRHRKAVTVDFEDLPPSIPLKRETLTNTIAELAIIDHSYSRISNLYQGVSALELQAMRRTGILDMAPDLELPLYRPMQEANARIISLIQRFKALVQDEMDRLLLKLDEFPAAPEPQTQSKPSPGKKQKPAKAGPSAPVSKPAPKNRVEIRTQQNTLLSGKPRSDNPNIVDILDSHGQRKATYLRSSDGQYWVEHIATQTPSTTASPASTPVWATYETAAQKMLSETIHAESVADYLGRKKDSAPSAPDGLLEYHANRLEEHANEIQEITSQLPTAENRQHALDKIKELRDRAQQLRNKGRILRIDLIITNNAPTANDLQYLADSNNLSVRKTHPQRIPMEGAGSSRSQTPRDYIDEFELKIKDRNQIWAYAHLHYEESASDSLAFSAAHLKRPEQRFQGAQLQNQEAQAGRRYEIHRGALAKAQVQDILLSERFS